MPVVTRIGHMALVAFVVVFVAFGLIHIAPGDPALNVLGQRADPQLIAEFHHRMHLDQPLPTQFGIFLKNVLSGDFGTSLLPGNPAVSDIIFPALGVTAALAGLTVLFALVIAIPLGLTAGIYANRFPDFVIRSIMIILLATPAFFTGFLLLLLALKTGFAPVGGWGTGVGGWLSHLWLPALCLAGFLAPIFGRSLRQSVITTLKQDFIESALARGVRPRKLVLRHVLPNSLLPLITLVGYSAGTLMAGAVVIETIFNLPGLGSRLASAVANRDFPVIQGAALLAALVVVAANALTDVAYQFIDPRTRP